ncbi:alpha/beta hydrolase [Aphanizomenon flos-aquae FACHB-1040]|uniref:Alpha/beta hydrolase n=1 Tax=Aphanizomenon flos-aquae FACHB-1040 TaxID=2692887 RepID=A0ABR8BUP5_APHFL|nr:alpha/beta hydrolase [Aphanizomenon flos-aquae FACHB-1040]
MGEVGEKEFSQLPITNYQLPITNYQLPITHYPLPLSDLAVMTSVGRRTFSPK